MFILSADSGFASVCLDPSPRVLASGHDNSYCTLYDLRQGRLLQVNISCPSMSTVHFEQDGTIMLKPFNNPERG